MKGENYMNEIQIFNNSDFGEVRVTTVNNEPWFVGKDIAEKLGYSNTRDALARHVDLEDKSGVGIHDGSQMREVVVINESGLYSLILSSKLPTAKKFKHWVTAEVIPSIRKHGAYMTEDTIQKALTSPDFLIQLATQLKDEQEKRKALEVKIEQDKPKTIFADAITVSKTSILVGELAKLLRQNGIEIGQQRLFTWLRDNKYLISRKGCDYNMPTQRSMEQELFEIKESTYFNSDGSVQIRKTPKVTGKGQMYFINKFLGKNAI